MIDINEQFFNAYWTPGMKWGYSDKIPKEMMLSKVDGDGNFEWKPVKGTLTIDDYREVEKQFNVKFPISFIEWHKLYFFLDGDCSLIRLPYSLPTRPLEKVKETLDWDIPKELIPHGLIPFADEGNDTGPLVFDTRNQIDATDYPIRVYDHEYIGDLRGLSEVIFSSFTKLLECLTHFCNETKHKKSFEVIPDFLKIDPMGAGSTGESYWRCWIEMDKANFELFGY